MKRNLTGWFKRYLAGLRKHLQSGSRATRRPGVASRLGRQAVTLGLEPLDLARIHERAFSTLGTSIGEPGTLERAEKFFAEALIPIVETHAAARQSRMDLHRLSGALSRRTQELVVTKRRLQCGIIRRRTVEAALKVSGLQYSKLLRESLRLQTSLRQLTHKVLAAQEDERKKLSRELQDEIAQTLLGINVRLLNLKQEARSNSKGFKKEIASAQRLVVKSARSVRRVAREFGNA
jgi:signal transduction histidine kinase